MKNNGWKFSKHPVGSTHSNTKKAIKIISGFENAKSNKD